MEPDIDISRDPYHVEGAAEIKGQRKSSVCQQGEGVMEVWRSFLGRRCCVDFNHKKKNEKKNLIFSRRVDHTPCSRLKIRVPHCINLKDITRDGKNTD